MKKYCIYKHTSPSGKVYIGQTCMKPEDRWRNGRGYRNQLLFYRAIQKYGWENFTHEILFDGITKEEADMWEIFLIHIYKRKKISYNLDSGGNANKVRSEETKKKLLILIKTYWDKRGRMTTAEKNEYHRKSYQEKKEHVKEINYKARLKNKERIKEKDHQYYLRKKRKKKVAAFFRGDYLKVNKTP